LGAGPAWLPVHFAAGGSADPLAAAWTLLLAELSIAMPALRPAANRTPALGLMVRGKGPFAIEATMHWTQLRP